MFTARNGQLRLNCCKYGRNEKNVTSLTMCYQVSFFKLAVSALRTKNHKNIRETDTSSKISDMK